MSATTTAPTEGQGPQGRGTEGHHRATADRSGELVGALARVGVDVDASSRRRAEYAYDASLYRVPPMAVAFPRDADDVAAAVSVARDLGVPVTPRGGGTSIAGNAVGPGLVLDLSRRVDRIGAIDARPASRMSTRASCSTTSSARPRRTACASDPTRRRTTAAASAG
jgi:hypothetical protein